MRDPSAPFRIAAARGALDAGAWAIAAALVAAGAGGWTAAGWPATLARVLLAAVSTGAGIAALWYAVRIEIDRRLFAALAQATGGHASVDDGLAALDRALVDLGWIDAAKAGRTLDARVRGAVGLCRAAVLVAVVQWIVVGIAIAGRPIG
ncbi:hypothetical protein [Burkholderia sp. NRF60-BP8]|uniref:hypothetical protein n=1 Tax=Burkholderia sp. NRF60-BP8 TaxID=1637853 RepID=UPI0007554BFC|nr:hypothetical protein [Burkholderia sp. NRF60-BP8]AOI78378.1 hypothetical protein WS54_18910 [Burkholderia sp. NRF60-BP8]KVA09412.1 hypothetical protein WS54_21315 [Burkholderia sp. NRF60-BP8]